MDHGTLPAEFRYGLFEAVRGGGVLGWQLERVDEIPVSGEGEELGVPHWARNRLGIEAVLPDVLLSTDLQVESLLYFCLADPGMG